MKFNEKLMELRKKEGLSQEQLGQKLDVARQTVSKWELGETTPEMDKLVKMSELFSISIDELIKDTDNNISINSNTTNTQKLAGMVIKILKIIGILIIVSIVLSVLAVLLFSVARTHVSVRESAQQVETIENE
ncbi:MAG: helix-turn-helix domain-containing protein [Lachnospiraceae bacterium]|jgi:transcriptional regulator with XRE-family HTH domain|nr:helix-turn-helix domain-containing protein [Lachnospiraceae bacterium]